MLPRGESENQRCFASLNVTARGSEFSPAFSSFFERRLAFDRRIRADAKGHGRCTAEARA